MIRLKNIRIPINSQENLESIIIRKLKVNEIISYKIHKKSIDARNKKVFSYVYDFDIMLAQEEKFLKNTKLTNVFKVGNEEYILPQKGSIKLKNPPIVVGMGPAGLFCAYFLAKLGYKPIIFERGKMVDERVKDIDDFWQKGILNKNSNVQFGEGGAGTFSDGKLNTLVSDSSYRMKKVFEIFVECGAPKEILYDSKPHIGTDKLRNVIKCMRSKIISMGGVVHFNSFLEDIIIQDNQVKGVIVNGKTYETECLVLATGHSARETYLKLYEKNIVMEAKPLAIGVRIMHSQDLINKAQYPINYPFLPPASYKLTYKAQNNRGVYSFCMCPGGYVVNASSEEKRLVVNGMSNYKRDSFSSNSAIIVTVSPSDFGSSPLDGIKFLESIENKAYNLGNGAIPIQYFKDYEIGKISNINNLQLDVKGKTSNIDINKIFPDYINSSLKEGINYFDKLIPGFAGSKALILAPETRTSSPVRIPRSDSFETNIKGIYPCGEGSGYAGGITTSAIDGIKVMESIVKKYYF
jgi:hypothetical protein